MKVIQILNEHKVSLYVKNYNLETLDSEGRVNPVASLICIILLEVAAMERLTIKERMASGRDQYIEKCRREGIKMGRPSTYRKSIDEYKKQYQREFSLIRKGLSLANISAITGTSISTIQKLRIMEKEALSHDIAKKIQDEMTYPGQVKITVIRETRSVSYAK